MAYLRMPGFSETFDSTHPKYSGQAGFRDYRARTGAKIFTGNFALHEEAMGRAGLGVSVRAHFSVANDGPDPTNPERDLLFRLKFQGAFHEMSDSIGRERAFAGRERAPLETASNR